MEPTGKAPKFQAQDYVAMGGVALGTAVAITGIALMVLGKGSFPLDAGVFVGGVVIGIGGIAVGSVIEEKREPSKNKVTSNQIRNVPSPQQQERADQRRLEEYMK